MATKSKTEARQIRHRRVRKKIRGTAEKPRVAVFRSLRHISGQAIDDIAGRTLCSVTTAGKESPANTAGGMDSASQMGKALGEKLKAAGISEAVFDRGGFLYHGRVAAFAEGVREAGVKI